MLAPDAHARRARGDQAGTRQPVQRQLLLPHAAAPDPEREAAWRAVLAPYYRELGIDPQRHVRPARPRAVQRRSGRACWASSGRRSSASISACRHQTLLARVRGVGREGAFVGDHGRRGALARGARRRRDHRAGRRGRRTSRQSSSSDDLTHAGRHVRAGAADRARGEGAGDRRRRHRRREGRRRGDGARRRRRAGRHGLSAVPGGDDQRGASRGAEERGRAPHGAHQPLHRPAGARHRQPPHARARADERRAPPDFRSPPPRSRRCARRRRARARAISRRCGRARTRAAAGKSRRPSSTRALAARL